MSHVEHERPIVHEAACHVDPMNMASALYHIARTAAASRSQTRRIRWIENRAMKALRGEDYRDIDVVLPKSAGPQTAEKLNRKIAYHIATKMELLEALEKATDALAGGLWDYGPGQDEHEKCNELIEEFQSLIKKTKDAQYVGPKQST